MMNFILFIILICFCLVSSQEWEDSEVTSSLWSACSRHDTYALSQILTRFIKITSIILYYFM
jgi:hypothetical protein